jgi:hypothetical protein
MAKVVFSYAGTEITIQCNKEDKIGDICKKFATKIDKNVNSLIFIYNGNKINYELTFKKQSNSVDNARNQMNVLVYQNENDELKCKKCGEIMHLDIIDNIIKFNKEEKETIIEMKNQIDNILNLNNIDDILRKIKFIKSVLNNLITEKDKFIRDMQNNINNNDIRKYENNDNKFEITVSHKLDSNEVKTLKTFIFKSIEQYSDYGDIAKNIYKDCEKWKEGKWAVIVGERDKYRMQSYINKCFYANLGLYKIAIDYIP